MSFRVLFGVAVILAGVSLRRRGAYGHHCGRAHDRRGAGRDRAGSGKGGARARQGLDTEQLRAQRVLMPLFSGTVEEGDLPGAGGTAEGRWIDFTSGAQFPDPSHTTSGTASVSGGAFGGACPGVADTEEFTCTTGRQAVLADVTVERSSQLVDIDWDAVVLPAFRIVGSVFDP